MAYPSGPYQIGEWVINNAKGSTLITLRNKHSTTIYTFDVDEYDDRIALGTLVEYARLIRRREMMQGNLLGRLLLKFGLG